ncbi:MAG: Xylose isomerase domain protein TIM barrel [Candidatus Gottesmanbacteria bacterium GW2011_GWA1_34_13]|uniref:Xylose isomerase domain protein TIM barrel n=1 Tax=Candidatus Gottesmanbacteria bacterium GW2011_GWA1_34_13 TaxID=1618434 RepID=A0A0G0D4E0_9BACT|nr:MAG: Xylose isomerase domain protein TIM barrel [Candidatus Gottesmanbacteria bacterium GW2011_GWA1_34_13]
MKIGTFLTIENYDWIKSFDILKKYDFEFFELMPEFITPSIISSLKNTVTNKEIILHAPFIEPNLVAASDIIRKAAKEYYLNNMLPLINIFRPKVVTTHLGSKHKLYKEINFQELLALYKIIPEMTFENMIGKGNFWHASYPNTEKQIDEIIKKTNLPMTFDVGHWLKQNIDVYQLLKKYLPQIKNIHIHDLANGKDHQTIGTGILDLKKFMNILKENKYNGYLSIELIPDNLSGVISSYKLLKKYI